MADLMIQDGEGWKPFGAVTSVTLPEPMVLTKRNDGERDFPEWFHQAMMENKIIAHGMGKFGRGPVFLEAWNRHGKRVVIHEGDLFAPDSDSGTVEIVQRRGDAHGH